MSHARLIDPHLGFTGQDTPKFLFVLWEAWTSLQVGNFPRTNHELSGQKMSPFFPKQFFFFVFVGPYLRHVQVPSLGVESELQLLAYTIATGSKPHL